MIKEAATFLFGVLKKVENITEKDTYGCNFKFHIDHWLKFIKDTSLFLKKFTYYKKHLHLFALLH